MSLHTNIQHKHDSMIGDNQPEHFFLLNYRHNFLYGYQLISNGKILLQKFGYTELQDALNDTVFVRQNASLPDFYRVEPVRSLQCVSISLRSLTTQLIGFKSGFPNVKEANEHIEEIKRVIPLLSKDCQFSEPEQHLVAYA